MRSLPVAALCFLAFPTFAAMPTDPPTADTAEEFSRVERDFGDLIRYGERGLELGTVGGGTDLWLGLRFQTRLDNLAGTLTSVEDLLQPNDAKLQLRRGRIKGGGSLIRRAIQPYGEYDFTASRWLDYRVTLELLEKRLALRGGQWKSEFNRERVDSSGKQQFVERSVSNYYFTVDRQRGLAAAGRLFPGTRADLSLWLEALTGTGAGASPVSDARLWLARAQWNPAGEVLPFSQSALKRSDRALPSIAVAVIDGRTPFTRFSGSGGGSLPGFAPGDFRLRQWLFETAVHYRGLSWQQELHWKRLRDLDGGATTRLLGGYAQLGAFLNSWWPAVPPAFELAGRFSAVDVDTSRSGDNKLEYTLAANWFFQGHRNKLTLDVSRLNFEDNPEGFPVVAAWATRVRLQWELSL